MTKVTVPSGVKAGVESTSSIKIMWNRVSGASGYQVFRATSSSGTYTSLGTVTTLNKVSTGLTPGSIYYYKIRTVREVNGKKYYSDYSSVVSAVTDLSAPSGVKAASASSSSIKVTWNKVTGASGYQVFRSTSESGTYTSLGYVTTLSKESTGLTAGQTYYYKVRAYSEVNGKKNYSDYSSIVSAFPKPAKPTNLKAVSASATSIKLTWSKAAGATGYQIWRSTSSNGTYTSLGYVPVTDKVSSGLTTGTTYYYKVRAYVEKNGTKYYGEYSSVVSATPKPSTPTNVKATVASATSIKLTWSKVAGASGYQIMRSTSANGTYTSIGTVTGTSKTSTGLKTGTTYYYKVRAYTEVNGTRYYGAYSTVVSAKPTK
jgi:fibronectin type 3 domain-containing protein